MTKYYFLVNGIIYMIIETNAVKSVMDTARMIKENYMEKGDHLEIQQVNPDGSKY